MEQRLLAMQATGECPLDPGGHFLGGRHIAADAAVEFDRPSAVKREPHIVAKLAVAHFHHRKRARAAAEFADVLHGKWVQSNGTKQSGGKPAGAQPLDDSFQDSAYNAVSNQ